MGYQGPNQEEDNQEQYKEEQYHQELNQEEQNRSPRDYQDPNGEPVSGEWKNVDDGWKNEGDGQDRNPWKNEGNGQNPNYWQNPNFTQRSSKQSENQKPTLVPVGYWKRMWYLWGALIIKVLVTYAVTLVAEVAYIMSHAAKDPEGFMALATDQDAMWEFSIQIVEDLMPYTTLLDGAAALVIIPILYFMFRKDRRKEKQFGIVQPSKAPLWRYSIIAVLSVAMCIGVNNIFYITGFSSVDENYTEVTELLYSADLGVQLLCLGILVPIAEEMVFRGIMFKRLRVSYSYIYAAIYTSIAFGIFHGNFVQLVYAFTLGFLFTYLYEKYGSVKAPIFAHIVMNITSVLATNFQLMNWMAEEYIRIGSIAVICAAVASTMFVLVQRMEIE